MNPLFPTELFGWGMAIPLLGSVLALVVTTTLIVVASDYHRGWKRRKFLGPIPLMDDESYFSPKLRLWRSTFNYLEGFERGYKEYSKKGKPWAVPLPGGTGDMIVLPPQCGKEYYNLSKDYMSMRHMMGDEINFNHVLDVAWKIPVEAMQACNRSSALRKSPLVIRIHVQATNSPGIPEKLDPLIMKEADYGIARYIGESKSWREVSVFEAALDVLGDIGVLLVFHPGFGREVGLSKKMQQYVGEVEQMTHLYAEYPRILAPLIWRFSSECRQIRSSMKSMKKTILPEVKRLIKEKKESKPTSDDHFYASSMVELALKKGPLSRTEEGKDDEHHIDMMADETMFMFFETVEPSVMILSALIVRLLRHPEYVAPIREEIAEALKANNGEWSFDIFNNTPRFESFSRETLRLDGIALVAGSRQVVGKPLTIHSLGMTFVPGTNITMSGQFTHLDPDFYPNPTKFDGNRFYSPGSSQTASEIIRDTISPTERWMVFGIGISACPARLLGTRLCQVVAAKMIMAYDMEFGHDGKLPDFNIYIDAVAAPNPEIKMRFKRRQ
ncbi:hypothetical protein FQN49_002419 [Arthroderma sp. PD_2]|nr:hypothetical protein FQN49_002419 [Arthroderma sp. PD_2]